MAGWALHGRFPRLAPCIASWKKREALEANARGHMPQMGAATGDDTEAAEDYVTPSREQFQACARVVFIHGLRKDAPAARHHRIGSEHRTSLPSGRDGAGLGFGQTQC